MTGKPDQRKDAIKRELDRLAMSSRPDPALIDAFRSLAEMQTGPQAENTATSRRHEALSSRARGPDDDGHNAS